VARARAGARAIVGGVAAPDIAGAIDEGIVRRAQRAPADLGAEDLDGARSGVEPLETPRIGRVEGEVGDDDAALAVHVDAVRLAARLAHPPERAVSQDLGAGARFVRGPYAPLARDHDVLGALEAHALLGERAQRYLGEGHLSAPRRLHGAPSPPLARDSPPACG